MNQDKLAEIIESKNGDRDKINKFLRRIRHKHEAYLQDINKELDRVGNIVVHLYRMED
jgi:hypothetical protein